MSLLAFGCCVWKALEKNVPEAEINAGLPCVATVPPPPPPQERVDEPPQQRAVVIPSSYRDARREPVTEDLVDAKRQRREKGASAISGKDEGEPAAAAASIKDKDATKGASSSSTDKDKEAPTATTASKQQQQKIKAVMGAAMARMQGTALTATTRERSASSSTDKGAAERRDKRATTAALLARSHDTQLVADDPSWTVADKETMALVKACAELTDTEALARRKSMKAEEEEEEELSDIVSARAVAAAMTLSPEVAASMVTTKVEQEKHEGWGAIVNVAKHEETAEVASTEVASTDATAAAHVDVRDNSLVELLVDEALEAEFDAAEDAADARQAAADAEMAAAFRRSRLMDAVVDPYQ